LASTGLKAEIAGGNTYTAGKVSLGKTTAKVTTGTGDLDIDSLSGSLKTQLDKTQETLTITYNAPAGAGQERTTGQAEMVERHRLSAGFLQPGGAGLVLCLHPVFDR